LLTIIYKNYKVLQFRESTIMFLFNSKHSPISLRLNLIALVLCVFSTNIAYAKKPIKKQRSKTLQTQVSSKKQNLATQAVIAPLATFTNPLIPNTTRPSIKSIAINPNGTQVLAGSEDGLVKVWDIATGNVAFTTNNPQLTAIGSAKFTSPVSTVAYSPDGQSFLSGSYAGTALFDANTGKLIKLFNSTSNSHALAFSPNGKTFVVGSAGIQFPPNFVGNIQIINIDTGAVLITIPQKGNVTSVAYSPDGLSFATVNNQEITLWDTATGNKIRYFDIHNYIKDQEYATAVAFSPDGQTLVTGGGENEPWHGVLRTWKVADATLINSIKVAQPVQTVAFNHAGNKIAVGEFGSSVTVYDANNLKLQTTFDGNSNPNATSGHTGTINAVTWSQDDKTLFSGSQDQSIKLWGVQ
jgi:WD40 repeat protein